ncbi:MULTISPECIES: DUF4232 domain-containing protein [Streptomyces]|uniref:DUF4232 domain-containing protein n=1 Tax=Streptomyces ramulosus TaxID=47762 RepID=A0ABW1FSN8_9ACTN
MQRGPALDRRGPITRTSRIHATVLATATLALSLTACGDGDTDAKSDAAGQSQSAASGQGAKGHAKSASASASTNASADESSDSAGVGECVVDELLLTASYEGSKPCTVTSYPSVKIDGEGATWPLSKKAEGGGQPIMLKPGGKVYSAVNIFDYRKDNKTGPGLSVALRDNNGQWRAPRGAGPAAGVPATTGAGPAIRFSSPWLSRGLPPGRSLSPYPSASTSTDWPHLRAHAP